MDNHDLHGQVRATGELSGMLASRGGLRGTVQSSKILVDDNYEILRNKPSVEGIELIGDHTLTDFGVTPISNMDIQAIIDRVFN